MGGDLDGIVMEIEPGQETIEPFAMGVVLGGAVERREQFEHSVWVYNYAHVEDGPEGPVGIFKFGERRERS